MYLILLMYPFYISVNNTDCYLYFYTLLNIKTAHWCYCSCQIFTLQGLRFVYMMIKSVCHYVNVTCGLQGKRLSTFYVVARENILPLNAEVNQILFSYFKGYEEKDWICNFCTRFYHSILWEQGPFFKKNLKHFLNRKYDIQPTYVHLSLTIKL